MKGSLALYAKLEQAMIFADTRGFDFIADRIRDILDDVWHSLSASERAKLDR